MDSHRPDPKNLRVSDAEREHVVSLLQNAVDRGLLDLEEFSARSDIALGAKTRAELNAVLLDLPGVTHTEQAPAPAPAARPDNSPPVVLRGTMSGIKRKGEWQVPRRLLIRTRMGSTELDFTRARVEHPEVSIELDVTAGSVELRVPREATVVADDVDIVLGSVQDKRRAAVVSDTGRGTPHIVVTGTIRAGTLVIRRPWNLLG